MTVLGRHWLLVGRLQPDQVRIEPTSFGERRTLDLRQVGAIETNAQVPRRLDPETVVIYLNWAGGRWIRQSGPPPVRLATSPPPPAGSAPIAVPICGTPAEQTQGFGRRT